METRVTQGGYGCVGRCFEKDTHFTIGRIPCHCVLSVCRYSPQPFLFTYTDLDQYYAGQDFISTQHPSLGQSMRKECLSNLGHSTGP